MTPRNYDKRADEHLAIIRTIALSLPLGQRLRIQNHCDRLAVLYRKQQRHLESLPETDDRTDAQVAGQIAAERSTAERIVSDHRGRIWAEGKEGTNTFFVALPLA